jgi:hypothetical protein
MVNRILSETRHDSSSSSFNELDDPTNNLPHPVHLCAISVVLELFHSLAIEHPKSGSWFLSMT